MSEQVEDWYSTGEIAASSPEGGPWIGISGHEAALQAERDKRREIESKLGSGYSFCHPEDNDCEGMRAAMAAGARESALRSKVAIFQGALEQVATERDREAACVEDAYRYQQAAEDLLNPYQVAYVELDQAVNHWITNGGDQDLSLAHGSIARRLAKAREES